MLQEGARRMCSPPPPQQVLSPGPPSQGDPDPKIHQLSWGFLLGSHLKQILGNASFQNGPPGGALCPGDDLLILTLNSFMSEFISLIRSAL